MVALRSRECWIDSGMLCIDGLGCKDGKLCGGSWALLALFLRNLGFTWDSTDAEIVKLNPPEWVQLETICTLNTNPR